MRIGRSSSQGVPIDEARRDTGSESRVGRRRVGDS
ncbi:Uncharacterised protein [Mycobacteroides abscessus subsp. abscessus]|nr:Uncharacterised protein [Mycobacteroides abscessus subsp. abscessus]